MDDKLTKIFKDGLFLLGCDSEMSIDDVKILRAWLADGFYKNEQDNKLRKSKKSDYEWMLKRAEMMGGNV